MIKPLLLSIYDIEGGASRSAHRLHKGLQKIGLPSQMLVQRKISDDDSIFGPQTFGQKILAKISPYLNSFPIRRYLNWKNIVFSPAFAPDCLVSQIQKLFPDIIHLHWVAGGFLRIETIKKINKIPVVWTLHDMWAFTGGCHYCGSCLRYQENCGRCPQLFSIQDHDISQSLWRKKKKFWANLNMTLVAPSAWMASCAKASSLFQDLRIEVIPYGLDTQIFKPIPKKTAREILNIPLDKKMILFGACEPSNPRKGFKHLQGALEKIRGNYPSDKIELLIFGLSKTEEFSNLGFQVKCLGRIYDDVTLALIYSCADLFIAPSTEDNLPNTVLEALSCGTPCIAFNIGGMPDLIDDGINGFLVPEFKEDELAARLILLMENDSKRSLFSQNARIKVEKKFSLEMQAQQYLKLYEELLRDKGIAGANNHSPLHN